MRPAMDQCRPRAHAPGIRRRDGLHRRARPPLARRGGGVPDGRHPGLPRDSRTPANPARRDGAALLRRVHDLRPLPAHRRPAATSRYVRGAPRLRWAGSPRGDGLLEWARTWAGPWATPPRRGRRVFGSASYSRYAHAVRHRADDRSPICSPSPTWAARGCRASSGCWVPPHCWGRPDGCGMSASSTWGSPSSWQAGSPCPTGRWRFGQDGFRPGGWPFRSAVLALGLWLAGVASRGGAASRTSTSHRASTVPRADTGRPLPVDLVAVSWPATPIDSGCSPWS